jgi:ribosomal protein S18 acetylase RimI-like enzyme
MSPDYTLAPAEFSHGDAILALVPEIANFDIPARRKPEDLWHGDAEMVQAWIAGQKPECFGFVALDSTGTVAGFSFVSMREELLTHAPSAHLEVLAVAPHVRRSGLGTTLSNAAETEARKRGAKTITLHVFGKNTRARALYAKLGYDEELIRAIKDLE